MVESERARDASVVVLHFLLDPIGTSTHAVLHQWRRRQQALLPDQQPAKRAQPGALVVETIHQQLSDAPAIATYKATRGTIVDRLKGTVLEGTGEEVPENELDPNGRYRRIATGWGELP